MYNGKNIMEDPEIQRMMEEVRQKIAQKQGNATAA
jgi:hypothetical protein